MDCQLKARAAIPPSPLASRTVRLRALAREGKAFDEESAECAVGVFACRRM
jgi:hypothetical protein